VLCCFISEFLNKINKITNETYKVAKIFVFEIG
jgi:hypothetical protein